MRVGIFVVSASLAGAGVAFAQSDWVVDPWASTPSITPLPTQARAPVEWIDERNLEPTDPWLSSMAAHGASTVAPLAAAQSRSAPARASGESGEWAKPVPLLVDPWDSEPARSPAAAADLIVDPWAHDVYAP